MSLQLQLINECVILTKYTDPISQEDLKYASLEITDYAYDTVQPLMVVIDFSDIHQFPSFILNMALRKGQANPIRNRNIEKIVLISDSPLAARLATTIGAITRLEKFVVANNWEKANREIELFVHRQLPKAS